MLNIQSSLNSYLLERGFIGWLLIYDSHVVVRSVLMTCVDDGMSDEVEVGEDAETGKGCYSSALETKILYENEIK
jgi:hypothetical protein